MKYFRIMDVNWKHHITGPIQPTSITGGGEGGTLAACFTTKLLRRISVPGGGPSK